MAATVGIAVFETVITSSPFFILKDLRAINNASVPLDTPRPYLELLNLQKFFSKFFNSLPSKREPLKKTLLTNFKIFFLNSYIRIYNPNIRSFNNFFHFIYVYRRIFWHTNFFIFF